ncbi:C-type lectin LmsL-like [Onychostoma macrolepis]|uniref:C-type lectin LmsL-like n=1 Tax=Onychostoma macrolepis TaxID=369639 RepID=UPI002729CE28|nr:C-type lectin LmsL-like [Onychostoma macrolepis]
MNYMPTATTNTTVLIREKKSWRDALNYCRLFHTDLATIENQAENTKLKQLLLNSNVESAFMGLYRDSWKWSDQSSSVFTAWGTQEPNNGGGGEYCALLDLLYNLWNDVSCSMKLKFLCGTAKKIQILKINMQSTLNLDVSDFNSTILQQLQQKLRKLGLLSNTKLTWRTQPDGQIFHTPNEPSTKNNKQCKTVT